MLLNYNLSSQLWYKWGKLKSESNCTSSDQYSHPPTSCHHGGEQQTWLSHAWSRRLPDRFPQHTLHVPGRLQL